MKVYGENAPSVAFSTEEIPGKPGILLARFYENAEAYEREVEGKTESGYMYDEYHLELAAYPGIEVDIQANLQNFLNAAKSEEAEKVTVPELLQKIEVLTAEKAALEAQLTDTQLALCEVYEMALGG